MGDSPAAHAVLTAVRAMIEREVARVDDPVAGKPGGDPGDVSGWHAWTATDPAGRDITAPGRPLYDAEAWRWFRLVDVAVLDDAVLVQFAWDEPGAPDLRYLALCPAGGFPAREAALRVRACLRDLLAPEDALRTATADRVPGWRHRVARTWLTRTLVLVRPPRAVPDQSVLDETWYAARD